MDNTPLTRSLIHIMGGIKPDKGCYFMLTKSMKFYSFSYVKAPNYVTGQAHYLTTNK